MTHAPNTWRPDGASDHEGWEVLLTWFFATNKRTGHFTEANIAAEQEAVRAVNEWLARREFSLAGTGFTLRDCGCQEDRCEGLTDGTCHLGTSIAHSRSASSDAAEGAGNDPTSSAQWNAGCDFAMMQLCTFLGIDPHMVSWDAATETVDGDVCAVIGNILHAKFGEDWSPTIPPKPAPDAMRDLADQIIGIQEDLPNEDDRDALGKAAHYLRKFAPVPSPDGADLRWLNDLIKAAEAFRVAVIFSRALDKVPQDQFIDQLRTLESALNPFNYRPSPTGAAEPDAVQAALMKRVSDAWQITLTEPSENWEMQPPMNERYTQYVLSDAERVQLRDALSAPTVADEQHIARFLARLVYCCGVAYGPGIESADTWVDANWRFFLGARRLGGIAPLVGVTREIDDIAREITNEIRCEERARDRIAEAPLVGDVYLLKILLEVIDNQSAALREYQTTPVPDATVSAEPVAWRSDDVADATADIWRAYCAETSEKERSPQGALAFGVAFALSPQDVGREATVEEWLPIDDAARDGREVLLRQGIAGPVYAGYYGLAPMAFGAGASTSYPWTVLDNTNGVNHLKAESVAHYRSLAANGGGRG